MTLNIVAPADGTAATITNMNEGITVTKSLGSQEEFNRDKLLHAILKASGYSDDRVLIAEEVADYVVKKVSAPAVTTGYINALVEGYLLAKFEKTKNSQYRKVLDKYVQNKRRKQDELAQKVSHMKDVILGAGSIKDLRKFSFNQTQIAAARYLLRDIKTGEVIETIPEWFHRIASHVVLGSIMYDEEIYDKEPKYIRKTRFVEDVDYKPKNLGSYQVEIIVRKYNELVNHTKHHVTKIVEIIDKKLFKKYEYLYRQYYDFMYEGVFEPNTPTLLNMGTPSGAGSACFTINVDDNMESITKTWHDAAMIFKTAGGFGTNISNIRPPGSPVGNTYNAATGGIALVLEVINKITDEVKAGGKRRGANMGILSSSHPQILEFIDYKLKPGRLENFNISVMFDSHFWDLYNQPAGIVPLAFNNNTYDYVDAQDLIKRIADNAWKSAEPGVLFSDNANKKNPLRELWGDIKITNPCFHPDTLVETVQGQVKIKDIKEPIRVYTSDSEGRLTTRMASASWKTRENAETLKITMNNGKLIIVTPEHEFLNFRLDWVKAQDFKVGDTIVSLCRARRGACYSGIKLSTEENRAYRMEHRFVYEQVYGDIPFGYDIHHINKDTYDNSLDNLDLLSHENHSQKTALNQPNNHQYYVNGRFASHDDSRKGRKTIIPMPEHLRSNHPLSRPRIVSIEKGPIIDVYDIEVEDTHNLIANGMVAHNCVSATTRLHTNKGMRQVEDLYDNNEPIEVAVDTVLHRSFRRYSKQNETLMMQKTASKVFRTSDAEALYRIHTEDGYELDCTGYHPMVLADGRMRNAYDLKIGDELLLQSSKGLFGGAGSSDLGALLGFAQNHTQLIGPDDRFIDDAFQKYTCLNKFDNIYHRLNRQYIPDAYGNIMHLNMVLYENGFEVNRVPDAVWSGTELCVRAYLKLLFSTSAVCTVEKEMIRYYNSSKRFLQDLQILLINFGIKSTIREHYPDVYTLTVSGRSFKPYMYRIGLTTSSKIRNIDVPRNSTGEVKYLTRVRNVERLAGEFPVYDAEEYETHKLIFNGIITGNCSEQYMYHGESCTLGSINLSKFTDGSGFDWTGYRRAISISTQFLNDVLEVNQYPTEDIKKNSNITKRIGLGIMGLADLLFKMRISYNSKEGYDFMSTLGNNLYYESVGKSIDLAGVRGACDAYNMLIESDKIPMDSIDRIYPTVVLAGSESSRLKEYGVRNMWTTTIAPTGTISMIADCSNGLEPIYALVYRKTVQTGDHYYLNKEFENALVAEGLYSDEIIRKVEANYGSVQGLDEIPDWMQDVFVTAMDLHWTDHVVAQAIWQTWIDNSISKTVNMPYNVTPEDIEYAYVLSHELGLKGVSVYRDGSRHLQVLHTDTSVKQKDGEIGAKSSKEMTLIKKQLAPSAATIDYIMKNVKNKDILDRFMKYIDNGKQQIYIQADEKCEKCLEGVYVDQGGCRSCNICGYSVSCGVG